MKSRIFRRDRRGDTIAALYGMIVAQARSPAFYRVYESRTPRQAGWR